MVFIGIALQVQETNQIACEAEHGAPFHASIGLVCREETIDSQSCLMSKRDVHV